MKVLAEFCFLVGLVTHFSANASAADECAPTELQAQLVGRAAQDQAARKEFLKDPKSVEANEKALEVDRDNTAWLLSTVEKCRWPKMSEVGEEAATDAWLLAQHADMAPELQAKAAQAMKYAVFAGEADGKLLALLVDRNRVTNNELQVYGMSYKVRSDGKIVFDDIINASQLGERRRSIKIGTFLCYAEEVSRKNGNAEVIWPLGVPLDFAPCNGSN